MNTKRICKICQKEMYYRNKYNFCWKCYCISEERKKVAQKNVKNRKNYNGKNNPNYRGKTKFLCLCKKEFFKRVSPSQIGQRIHIYCSVKCKKKYSISKNQFFKYKGYKLRSSWELSYAKYLDKLGYHWKYEPQSFFTSYGFYTPDFWVEELKSYVEIKGFFRDKNAKLKFKEFSNLNSIILADLDYLRSIGFERIKSGSKKGQLCHPAVQH